MSRRSTSRDRPLANITKNNIGGIHDVLKNLIALDAESRRAQQQKEIREAKDQTKELADWITKYKAEEKAKAERKAAALAAKEKGHEETLESTCPRNENSRSPDERIRGQSTEPESGVESGTEESSALDTSQADSDKLSTVPEEPQETDADVSLRGQECAQETEVMIQLSRDVAVVKNVKFTVCVVDVGNTLSKSAQRALVPAFILTSQVVERVTLSVKAVAPPKHSVPATPVKRSESTKPKPSTPLVSKKRSDSSMRDNGVNLVVDKPTPKPLSPNVARRSESIKRERGQGKLTRAEGADFGSITFLPQKPVEAKDKEPKSDAHKGLRAKLCSLKPSFMRRREKSPKHRPEDEYMNTMLGLKRPPAGAKEERPVPVPRERPTLSLTSPPPPETVPDQVEEPEEEPPQIDPSPDASSPSLRVDDQVSMSVFGRRLPKPRFIMRIGTPKRREGPTVPHPAQRPGELAKFVPRRAPPKVVLSEAEFVSSLPTVTLRRPPAFFLQRLEQKEAERLAALARAKEAEVLAAHRSSLKVVRPPRLVMPEPKAPTPPFQVKLKAPDHHVRPPLKPKRCQQAAFTPRWRRLDVVASDHET